jgi:rfaE bifunctional protein kinase chain/domain
MAGAGAYISEHHRLEGVAANGWVDQAMIIDEPVIKVIDRLQPDIVVKGKEHETRSNPELASLELYGGKLLFSSGESTFSSIDLLRREFTETNLQTISLPQSYMARHHITPAGLADRVSQFSDLRVCVIGDLIVDEYITCQPLGMSQEDPTLVVTPIDSTQFIGGAGIVAAHGAGLGADVTFISVTGNDTGREIATEALAKAGVKAELIMDPNRPTTLKQRFRSKGKTLLRVSHLRQGAIHVSLQKEILEHVKALLPEIDLLVFSDFNYGCLPQPLVEKIIDLAGQENVMMVADSQSSSQVGDISRFKDMHLITPTEREARLAMRNTEDGLVVLAEKLRQNARADNVLLTLGEEGVLIHASAEDRFMTDRITALNAAPKDVVGAGDSMLIAGSLPWLPTVPSGRLRCWDLCQQLSRWAGWAIHLSSGRNF